MIFEILWYRQTHRHPDISYGTINLIGTLKKMLYKYSAVHEQAKINKANSRDILVLNLVSFKLSMSVLPICFVCMSRKYSVAFCATTQRIEKQPKQEKLRCFQYTEVQDRQKNEYFIYCTIPISLTNECMYGPLVFSNSNRSLFKIQL